MTDEELDALVHTLWHGEVTLATVASSADAITTLRAQLAEALEWNGQSAVRAEKAGDRADRAEAALAAQIEVDAGVDPEKFLDLVIYAAKEAREKALREAAQACDWGDIYGDNAVRTILALIEKEKTK